MRIPMLSPTQKTVTRELKRWRVAAEVIIGKVASDNVENAIEQPIARPFF
jgi:hypothetical protein